MRESPRPRTLASGFRLLLLPVLGLLSLVLAPARAEDAPQPQKRDTPAALARMVAQQVQFSTAVTPEQARPGEEVTFTVTATLQDPWHIYGQADSQPAEGPRSTQFDLFHPGGLEPVGSWTADPEPVRKPEPAFDNQVYPIHEGRVAWSHTLRVPADSAPGQRTIQAQIYFQICDPSSCKPPIYMTLDPVQVTILPGTGTGAAATTPPPAGSDAPATAAAEPAGEEATAVAVEPTREPEMPAEQAAPSTLQSASTGDVQGAIDRGFIPFLLACALGGVFALLMPCVWPMVPITVNYFVKQGERQKGGTTKLALTYCLAIIGIFTILGLICAAILGPTAATQLGSNGWLNLFIAIVFIVFGLSLLGLFEIRLPASWLNASARAEGAGGLVGVIFMAVTLTITSFTCTAPVVGFLLAAASRGSFLYPIFGMMTFATVLALPFFVLALAPGMIKTLPRSGDWMNAVKVVGGLIEIGAAFKFLNVAEVYFFSTPQNAWIDAQVVLTVWVIMALVAGFYLLGLFRTDHDHEAVRAGAGRIVFGSLFLGLSLYFAPALFGFPPQSRFYNIVVGILPADVHELNAANLIASKVSVSAGEGLAGTSGGGGPVKASSTDPEIAVREEKTVHGVQWGLSYEAAVEQAQVEGRPILVDFTGVNCANCRTMEQAVMPQPEVVREMSNFVTVQLYTDSVPIDTLTPDTRRALAEQNLLRELELTNQTTSPLYVVLSPDETVLGMTGFDDNPGRFVQFLQQARARLSPSTEQVAQVR